MGQEGRRRKMLRCSKEAFAKCPYSKGCASLDGALFIEGSECDAFNKEIDCKYEKIVNPKLVEQLRSSGLTNGARLGWHSGLIEEAADAIEALISERDEALKYVPKECSTCAHWLRRAPGECECGAPEELGPCDLGARQIWAWKGVKHDD